MSKYIVLSVNDNPDYLYHAKLACWAWKQFGWEPVVFYHGKQVGQGNDLIDWFLTTNPLGPNLKSIDGYRSDTITQISRLYAACVYDGYLMTGDIDMIPLSNYWQPNEDALTVYGHDLTDYGHYPICYIGMKSDKWRKVMHLDNSDYNQMIERDLHTLPQARNPDFYKYWFSDQDLITEKINNCGIEKTIINRGKLPNGYARGRVDRGSWNPNLPHLIDCHMFTQLYFKNNVDKFELTVNLLRKVWPKEDFSWFLQYTDEFRRLTGQL